MVAYIRLHQSLGKKATLTQRILYRLKKKSWFRQTLIESKLLLHC